MTVNWQKYLEKKHNKDRDVMIKTGKNSVVGGKDADTPGQKGDEAVAPLV